MGKFVLVFLAFILLILFLPGQSSSFHEYNESNESEMFQMLNKYRQENGVPPLNWDLSLRDIARLRVSDMVKRGYFSHYLPPKSGFSAADLVEAKGICASSASENIAYNTGTFFDTPTEAAFKAFKNSEGHRLNMLNSRLKKVGIGVVSNHAGIWFFAQVFTGCE